jgi:hypothetical protein
LENRAKKELEELETASGIKALDMIKKLYENKSKYSESDFIREIIRLSFTS